MNIDENTSASLEIDEKNKKYSDLRSKFTYIALVQYHLYHTLLTAKMLLVMQTF